METLLLHESHLGGGSAQAVIEALQAEGVTLYGGPRAQQDLSLPPSPNGDSLEATFHHEWGSLEAMVEVVTDVQEAAAHINEYGSGHTESIVTECADTADKFVRSVDSACVFVNTSTRFADGYRFGLGAEVGISTARIHARGPVGVEGHVVNKDTDITYTHRKLSIADADGTA